MRRFVQISTALAITVLNPPFASAQDPKAREILEKAQVANPNLKVEWDLATGLPRRISGIAKTAPPEPAATMTAAAPPSDDEIKDVVLSWFGARQLSAAVNPNSEADVEVASVRVDPDIRQQYIATVQQRLNGIPIYASAAKVVVGKSPDGLAVLNLVPKFSALEVAKKVPSINSEQAIKTVREAIAVELAKDQSGTQNGKRVIDSTSPKAELIYFDPKLAGVEMPNAKTALSWQVSFGELTYFVDAASGDIIHFYRNLPNAMVRMVVDLDGATSLPGKLLVDESNHLHTSPLPEDAKFALDNLQLIYTYFFTTFSRDSYDNSYRDKTKGGAALVAYVRYGLDGNAHWCPDANCLQPDTITLSKGWSKALDIVAHEYTHGILLYEHGPKYSNEPGAVNEAFADIFGMLVEQSSGTGNWLIGEALPGHTSQKPLRDMANPGLGLFKPTEKFDPVSNYGQPDHYDHRVLPTDKMCNSILWQDNGCVHLNSGIINKMAELIGAGGTHRGVVVSGIGLSKLARLSYRVLVAHLLPASKLQDAASAFRDACRTLADEDELSSSDCTQVDEATKAVGLFTVS